MAMNENSSKIHVKVGEIEISIEGKPDFVTKQYKEMEKELNLRQKITGTSKETPGRKRTSTTTARKTSKTSQSKKVASTKESKDGFSEWLEKLPKGLKNKDKALVAAYYNQLNSKKNVFRVRDMNNTLKNHGIKITNPSSLIKNVAKTQKIINQVSREGRQVYYKFTKEGEGYINKLVTAQKR